MRKIYFVRHGETNGNLGGYWQGPDEPLNENGLKQARILANRVKDLNVGRVISSSMKRAVQTADVIAQSANLSVEYSDLFREVKNPTSVQGYVPDSDKDKLIELYKTERLNHLEDIAWHFEDEENVADMTNRIKEAASYLDNLKEESVLIVSHGNFIRNFTGHIITDGSYSLTEAFNFRFKLKTINTGITLFVEGEHGWQLLTWNDHAHFADN